MLPVGKFRRNKHLRLSQDHGGKTIGRRYRRYLRISRREERRTHFGFISASDRARIPRATHLDELATWSASGCGSPSLSWLDLTTLEVLSGRA